MKKLSPFRCSHLARRVKRKGCMKNPCKYCTALILVGNPYRKVNNNGRMKKLPASNPPIMAGW
jgi:hypothetical protein